MISQDPNAPADPDTQRQNLQNAQAALNYFQNLIEASEQVMQSLRNLEETLGFELNATAQFEEMIKRAAVATPAFNLLAQMNFVSSIDNLLDGSQIASIETVINNNIQSIQSGIGSYQQQ